MRIFAVKMGKLFVHFDFCQEDSYFEKKMEKIVFFSRDSRHFASHNADTKLNQNLNAKIQTRIFLYFFERKKYQKKNRKINKKCQKLVFAMNTPLRRPKCILVFCLIAF